MEPTEAERDRGSSGDDPRIEALLGRVQDLEDLVEELIEIALVNRSALLALVRKKHLNVPELREVYERIELAHEEARAGEEGYRILPAAGAYFLESEGE